MLLYLVRHGQTPMNHHRIVQGHLDPPLSPLGQEQAGLVGDHLAGVNFVDAYCGDLRRAEHTAEIALKHHLGVVLKPDERLKARFMGSMEGQPLLAGQKLIYPPDAETDEAMAARLMSWLSDLLVAYTPDQSSSAAETKKEEEEKCVLAVTHQECMRAFVQLFVHFSASQSGSILEAHTDKKGDKTIAASDTTGNSLEVEVADSTPDEATRADLTGTTVKGEIGTNIDGDIEGRVLDAEYGDIKVNSKSLLHISIPETVDTSTHAVNASIAILRVWWEEDGNGALKPKGRLESWATAEHLSP